MSCEPVLPALQGRMFADFAFIPGFKLSCRLVKHSSVPAQEGIDYPCRSQCCSYWQLAGGNACLAADLVAAPCALVCPSTASVSPTPFFNCGNLNRAPGRVMLTGSSGKVCGFHCLVQRGCINKVGRSRASPAFPMALNNYFLRGD